MAQLIQLDGELPEYFPGHDRRLHILICRKKACSGKLGCVRAIRSIKTRQTGAQSIVPQDSKAIPLFSPSLGLGNKIFKRNDLNSSIPKDNPFSLSKDHDEAKAITTTNVKTHESRSQYTKERRHSAQLNVTEYTQTTASTSTSTALQFWVHSNAHQTPPPTAACSENFRSYYLDAEYETLSADSLMTIPSREALHLANQSDDLYPLATESYDNYESPIDKTFQRFADRVAQNPLQVLRYEYGGAPLLYSSRDEVGNIFTPTRLMPGNSGPLAAGMPLCRNCGKFRVFEMQLTPQAICKLEGQECIQDGMEWGTIILGVCSVDCHQQDTGYNKVSHLEEWIGVQWEESKK